MEKLKGQIYDYRAGGMEIVRILIVEDERNLARILKKGLEEHGFAVELAFDGDEGLHLAETYSFDAVILDIMLPKTDGLAVLKELRLKKIAVPVLMLTAKAELEDRVRGLDIGADDYIAKPFDFSELLARLRAVIRRDKGNASPVMAVGDLELNMNSQQVRRGGKEIRLSSKEYRILEYFILNKDRIVSRAELIEHVYDMGFDHDSNVIDVYINYLRNKIDRGPDRQLIHTVRGSGYILKDEG